jgi:hypothetical protein
MDSEVGGVSPDAAIDVCDDTAVAFVAQHFCQHVDDVEPVCDDRDDSECDTSTRAVRSL